MNVAPLGIRRQRHFIEIGQVALIWYDISVTLLMNKFRDCVLRGHETLFHYSVPGIRAPVRPHAPIDDQAVGLQLHNMLVIIRDEPRPRQEAVPDADTKGEYNTRPNGLEAGR